jgi:hypothetical protein
MRVGAFEVQDPLPELHKPDVIAMLRPWIDAGDVGTLTISWLEKQCRIEPLAELARPGIFFDFTRYRPTVHRSESLAHVILPNTHITYGTLPGGRDLLFFHMLEPHMFGEVFVDSVIKLLSQMDIGKYILLGSMYDYVPHTRPLPVSGGAVGSKAAYQLEVAGIRNSRYEGPTSITSMVTEKLSGMGIDSLTMVVHLPQYTELDEDYLGVERLMEVLCTLFGLSPDPEIIKRAEQQRGQISEAVGANPDMKIFLEQMETHYDMRDEPLPPPREPTRLSPDVEGFLKDMEHRFGGS